MKLKKVEIQAFRAYKDKSDGTFDFTTETNEIADFISIYAPNGFGKTSFYDAVEWGFTNNVSRFLRRTKDNLNSAKAGDADHILRNQSASKELKTFVNLYMMSDSQPIGQEMKPLKKRQRDIGFKESDTTPGTEYFRDVLLAQEWIDAFLKEDDAAERYEKFIKSFGDVALDNKYKTITELIKQNEVEIKKIEERLKPIQKSINFDFDTEILVKINAEINELNIQGEKMPVVRPEFTDKELLLLSNLISDRLSELEFELSKIQEKIKKIDSAVTGNNENNIGIEDYFANKTKVIDFRKKLSVWKSIKNQFDQQHKEETLKASKEEELKHFIEIQDSFVIMTNIYPKYEIVSKAIGEINISINEELKELKIVGESLDLTLKRQNEIKAKSEIENKNYQELLLKQSRMPILGKGLTEKVKAQKELSGKIINTTESKSVTDKEIVTLDTDISEWQEIINQLLIGNYQSHQSIENEKIKPYIEDITKLYERNIQINNALAKIEKIKTEISNVDTLNEEIKQLITKGSDIVNKHEFAVCPLCKYEYDSFSTLSKRISNNTFLSERAKKLFEEKSEEEKNLSQLSKEQEAQKNILVDSLKLIANDLSERLSILKKTIEKNVKNIKENEENVKKLNDEISNITKEIGGDNIDEMATVLNEKIEASVKLLDEFNGLLETINADKLGVEEKVAKTKGQIQLSEEKIAKLKEDDDYIKILDFAKMSQIGESEIKSLLEKQKDELISKIGALNKDIKGLTESLNLRKEQIENFDFETVISEIEETTEKLRSSEKTLHTFEYLMKSEFEFDLSDKEKETVNRFLESQKTQCCSRINTIENVIKSFHKTREYKEHVVPYLTHEKLEKDKEELLKQKAFFMKSVLPELEQEKKKLSDFISRQIESFFHGKLINMLYQKIDPHPTYKEIGFSCDFNSDKPRLNVFVAGENGNNPIPPTLYFSTAQLNILSLSIFLAKALNVKDNNGNSVDCIFIDDPIQSMDDINILSTIDLLRSITVNMGKQIILATHNENFQNLLKKKMPSNIYKSKFIELESFGKVKQ